MTRPRMESRWLSLCLSVATFPSTLALPALPLYELLCLPLCQIVFPPPHFLEYLGVSVCVSYFQSFENNLLCRLRNIWPSVKKKNNRKVFATFH